MGMKRKRKQLKVAMELTSKAADELVKVLFALVADEAA